jgi:Arc/MetJ family transcription regulator
MTNSLSIQYPHQMMLYLGIIYQAGYPMRTTINLDDALLERAQSLSGVAERSALLREALTALIQRESARRLARLGGSEPELKPVPRRRSDSTS